MKSQLYLGYDIFDGLREGTIVVGGADYWLKWHLPETAKASIITLMQNKFNEKIHELKPNLEGYSLWIEQYNAWEDYTEYF